MISTKGRYAIRVMLDLAQNNNESNIPLKDVAQRQEISKKYLEQIVKELVAGGLLIGHSGKGGGYRLARKPEEYTLWEILSQMEGTLSCVSCLAQETNECPRHDTCQSLPLWREYDQVIWDFFHGKKLSDLLPKQIL